MHIHDIAKLCHEVNRAYCAALGDNSQLPWESAPQWQKESAVQGVQFHMHGEASPEQSHESWLALKLAEGWTYGPVKDEALKQHPCCVPYHMLPVEQKAKDYIFGSIVRTILAIEGESLGDGVVGDRAAAS